MFIAVYEFEIKDGKDSEFRASWLKLTQGIYRECGSLGSRLHRTEKENVFIAYAQWPDKKIWKENIGVQSSEFIKARTDMQACLVAFKTLYELEVLDDYLQQAVFSSVFS